MSPTDDQQAQGRVVPVRWVNVQDSDVVFSNTVLVQHTGHEFIITFGYIQPPFVMSEQDIEHVKEVESRALIRVAMSPSRAEELLKALDDVITKFRSGGGETKGQSGE